MSEINLGRVWAIWEVDPPIKMFYFNVYSFKNKLNLF
jgi:hypothetical protein